MKRLRTLRFPNGDRLAAYADLLSGVRASGGK